MFALGAVVIVSCTIGCLSTLGVLASIGFTCRAAGTWSNRKLLISNVSRYQECNIFFSQVLKSFSQSTRFATALYINSILT